MTRPAPPTSPKGSEYHCVEPELGEKIDLLEMNDLDAELAGDLRTHLEICHACRQLIGFDGVLRRELPGADWAEAAETAPRRSTTVRPSRIWTAAACTLALAAGLLLLLAPSEHSLIGGDYFRPQRSNGVAPHIERPVEGEMMRGTGGALEWAAIEGAYHYKVTVERVSDGRRWQNQLSGTKFDLPAGTQAAGDYIAAVEVVPANLLQRSEASVSFRRGSAGDWLRYRILHPHRAGALLAGLSLLLGVAAILRRA